MSDIELTEERLRQLLGLKLRALVSDHLGTKDIAEAATFGPGAGLVHDGRAWVYLEDAPERRFGAALGWMLRNGATTLSIVTEHATGTLARRAALFTTDIDVWQADARTLSPATAAASVTDHSAPADHEQFRSLIEEVGAVPQVEHGTLVGEARGLEICRVVDDPHLDGPRLEVGVGVQDREAFQMVHGDVATAEALGHVVKVVEAQRAVGVPTHPLNRMAAERLLRWRLTEAPSLIGLATLAPMPAPVPRVSLSDQVPCAALGYDPEGNSVVVVCSAGVDIDCVPFAADARLAATACGVASPRLIIVTPARDRVQIYDDLAGLLAEPVEFRTIEHAPPADRPE